MACDIIFEINETNFRATRDLDMVLIIEAFPKMIELFCRSGFKLKNAEGLTPIHIDNAISSLSAIFLDD